MVLALFPGQSRTLEKVRDMRSRLANELAETINEFGPKLYEDFNEVSSNPKTHACRYLSFCEQFRILVPSASAPPSSTPDGIWRLKSSTGAVDAQGNLLVHPMVRSNTFFSTHPLSDIFIDMAGRETVRLEQECLARYECVGRNW